MVQSLAPVRASIVALLLLTSACTTFRSHEGKVARLNDPDPEERYDNLLALADDAEDNPEQANELCDHALRLADSPESVPVRLVALRILGHLGKKNVRVKEVAQKLANHARRTDEPDFWCRVEALDALGTLVEGPQNHLPEESVRAQVHEALLIALSATLEPDRDVRIHAARELAQLRPDTKKVLDELVNALSDEAPDVRYHAQRALVAIAGDDHGPTKDDWKTWVNRHTAEQAEEKR